MQIQLLNGATPVGDRGIGRGNNQGGNFWDTLMSILVQPEAITGEGEQGILTYQGGQQSPWPIPEPAEMTAELNHPANFQGPGEYRHPDQVTANMEVVITKEFRGNPAKGLGSSLGHHPGYPQINQPSQAANPGSGLKSDGLPGASTAPGLAVAAAMVQGMAKPDELPRGEVHFRGNPGENPAGNPAAPARQGQGGMGAGPSLVNIPAEARPPGVNPAGHQENPAGSPPRGVEAGCGLVPGVVNSFGEVSGNVGAIQGSSESAEVSPHQAATLSLARGTEPLQAASRLAEVMRVVPTHINSGQTSLSLKLEPASLGKLTINLNYVGGNLTAKFITASGYVKEIIDGTIPHLKELLAEHNIKLQEATAVVSSEQGRRNEGFQGQGRGGHSRPGGEQREPYPEQESSREKQLRGQSLELDFLV